MITAVFPHIIDVGGRCLHACLPGALVRGACVVCLLVWTSFAITGDHS